MAEAAARGLEKVTEELQKLAAKLRLKVDLTEVRGSTEVGGLSALMTNVHSAYANPCLEEASGSMPKAPPG